MGSQAIVYVIDDDPDIGNLIDRLVSSVGLAARTFTSALDFLSGYDGARPGCVILDVRMPGMTGIEALTRFAEHGIRLPVIMLTGYGDVPTAVRSLKRGAVDFIQKPFNSQLLLERIQAAIAQDAARAEEEMRAAQLRKRFADLSRRENEVLKLVMDGKTSKEIGKELGISDKTVDVHRTNIMRKVGAKSTAALVKLALMAKRE